MTEPIDQLIEQIVQFYEIPGLAVGLVKDYELVYARGFGVKRLGSEAPVTPTSLFHLASVSKPFVATAIVQLVERGQVELQAPVVKYLPYFKLDDERYTAITVQQMLSHASGMPDTDDYGWERPEYDEGALERYVRSLSQEKLIAAPGEKYAYSNIAYEILGDLIAKVSGQTFEAYMADNILRPLGMEHSTFLVQEVAPELGTGPHLSTPHPIVSSIYPYNRAHAPSSTLHSNIVEMAHWAIANLNRGRWGGRQILQPSSYDLLWQPYIEIGEEEPGTSVGLSWFISNHKDHKTVDHSGGDIGFRTNLWLVPEQGGAVIVLANTVPAPVGKITGVLLDGLLGYEPEPPKLPLLMPLSRVLQEQGLTAALQIYQQLKEEGLDNYDLDPAPFYDSAEVLLEINRLPEAIEILKLGLAIQPEADHLYYWLALAYTKSGAREQALENVQRCLKLNPGHHGANELLEKLEKGG